jgi:hypothetical protein
MASPDSGGERQGNETNRAILVKHARNMSAFSVVPCAFLGALFSPCGGAFPGNPPAAWPHESRRTGLRMT